MMLPYDRRDCPDPVALAAARLAGAAEEAGVVGIVRDGDAVRVLRDGADPLPVDPETLDARAPNDAGPGKAFVPWNEVLYGLGVHDHPLRDLGKALHYLSITRDGEDVVVQLTDGVETARYRAELSDVAADLGRADDLAVAFIERDTSVLKFDQP